MVWYQIFVHEWDTSVSSDRKLLRYRLVLSHKFKELRQPFYVKGSVLLESSYFLSCYFFIFFFESCFQSICNVNLILLAKVRRYRSTWNVLQYGQLVQTEVLRECSMQGHSICPSSLLFPQWQSYTAVWYLMNKNWVSSILKTWNVLCWLQLQ